MPVDPEIQKILDVLNTIPPLDLDNLAPLAAAAKMRSAPITIPPIPHKMRLENCHIPGPNGDIPVRIYWPEGKGPGNEPCGVMVSYHGGGWVTGKLDSDEFKSHQIVHESGCAIVSVDYRMAPEFPFPVPVEDCYAAARWTYDNAASLGFDPRRLAVGGSSAGGNLAAAVCLMARERNGPPIRCQVLTYPVTDDDFDRPSYLNNAEGKLLSRRTMQWFWDVYVPNKADRRNPHAAPVHAKSLAGLPPALVITAEYDLLCDEGEHYADLMKKAGVTVQCTRYPGMVHGFLSAAILHASSQAALKETAQFLKKHIGN